ncbi:hypothetical protein L1049_005527 [Liquidambar formosana]|uniref:Protein TIFY n=1 Tax=Liquidambar formosana TaxID=63359 RepID=A0AAP0WRN8_LIQFO
MERDFLGMNSKEPLAVVKEEISDGSKDSGFALGSGIQWPFSNKVSALPHFMSFKAAQEDKPKKIVADPLASSGFMSISTADAFDPSHKRTTGEIQKTFNHDRQGGNHFSMTAYPVQHEVHSVHRPHDAKMFPVSNISVSMSNPFFKTHFGTTGQNLADATVRQQLAGGTPVTGPQSILHSVGSIAGVAEPWNTSKASGSPAQLTIFYAGSVNVYDDVTPEKAQAIMFLAGNGSLMASKAAHPRAQVQAPISKLATTDGGVVNQPMNTPPCSGLSSPISVSSHTGAQSGSGSTSTDELMTSKTTGAQVTPVSKPDPPKTVSSLGSVGATTMIPSAVPQARKASLARFLEKRKERVMNTAPYNLNKNSPECATPESNGVNVSASSGAGICSLPASK